MQEILRNHICGLIDSIGGQAVPKPAIRVRLNKGVFEQASTIVAGLVEYEVPRIKVPPTQQCFPEGCVQIHSFHMTSFRQPSSVTMGPHPPNQFVIRVTDFDFFVVGQLGGTITVLIQLPVAGTVHITAVPKLSRFQNGICLSKNLGLIMI
ncbi:hypothetical protein ANCCEY_06250 [Ancylostoma ceylanicum]|uniref:Lipid-binding serum glycoprotein N-terminal domain-containing protein n=1 Tax=Ancylostoma ceylanicum TaxID=53326 RepID=A0A0D6M433_9BILA|nr:hypothetical protein ANCCEY_06250 [Ancylostoma ceylanicum]